MPAKIDFSPQQLLTIIGTFHCTTNKTLALQLGVSVSVISRLAALYGLRKDPGHNSLTQRSRPHEVYERMVEKRRKMRERDQRRMLLGFEPLTNLRYSNTTREEEQLRTYMKRRYHYIIRRFDPVIRYDGNTVRRQTLEQHAKRLGIPLIPL